LTPQQEIELAAKIKNGDRNARALMISSNLRLVVTIAQDYANLGLPLVDVICEGNIGLMRQSRGSIHRSAQSSALMRRGGSDNP
jgi:RNA polymerase primary sigma factor